MYFGAAFAVFFILVVVILVCKNLNPPPPIGHVDQYLPAIAAGGVPAVQDDATTGADLAIGRGDGVVEVVATPVAVCEVVEVVATPVAVCDSQKHTNPIF